MVCARFLFGENILLDNSDCGRLKYLFFIGSSTYIQLFTRPYTVVDVPSKFFSNNKRNLKMLDENLNEEAKYQCLHQSPGEKSLTN